MNANLLRVQFVLANDLDCKGEECQQGVVVTVLRRTCDVPSSRDISSLVNIGECTTAAIGISAQHHSDQP